MRLIGLAALCLASCTAAPVADPPPSPASSIGEVSAEVNSWGVTLREWTVEGDGAVKHVSGLKVGVDPNGTMLETRRLRLTPEQLGEVRTAIASLKAALSEPEGCNEKRTDGPYGTFTWVQNGTRQAVRFSANCVAGRDSRVASAIFHADRIVDDAAKATEAVERHTYREQR
ncbi:hypothetical protein G7077_12095 [Sphingomonas piscis]|uniref:Uncharacterized protein n=1 Tax=Sphingomonas piscis TaxID=2714943 RepID=A0A6G7YS17_9SPHN|nr:hypothetical protein [Sphingomonas piscis]QIK79536.1 hypothetical protein G7077_12095 [Sphingomonas piscis]